MIAWGLFRCMQEERQNPSAALQWRSSLHTSIIRCGDHAEAPDRHRLGFLRSARWRKMNQVCDSASIALLCGIQHASHVIWAHDATCNKPR